MPPSTLDSETAAMYKSLLLRAVSVEVNDQPEDVRLADAFRPLCEVEDPARGHVVEPNQAFTTAWLAHVKAQKALADDAARLVLDRYEYMSLWEIQEIHDELNAMWETAHGTDDIDLEAKGAALNCPDLVSHDSKSRSDPDEGKPRATVRQYAALIGQKVMANLEGLARARREKQPRAYQTDAEIHQSYITATSGGADGALDGPEDGPTANATPTPAREVFPLLRWSFDQEEMRAILDFEHKRRPTPILKELLALPMHD